MTSFMRVNVQMLNLSRRQYNLKPLDSAYNDVPSRDEDTKSPTVV
jgi:hypothetical protein